MKILMTSAHSHEGETGSALIAEILARELSKKDKVLYLRLGTKLKKIKITQNLTFLTIPTASFHGIHIPIINSKIGKEIYKNIDHFKPKVVHAQNIIFGGLLALIWAKTRDVPFVLTPHHIPHEGLTFIFPKFKNNKFFIYIDRKYSQIYTGSFLRLADVVIALNEVVVDSLKIVSPKAKHVLINNGIKLKDFKSLTINRPVKMVQFLYPGTYIDRKNQEYLVKVFKYLPNNYVLNLYGKIDSGSAYVEKLKSIIKKGDIKNVNINEYVEEQKLLQFYQNSHYLVSASIKEVQSLVIIEALASGKPVIALKNETTSELINNTNGLVLPQETSPRMFAKKLLVYVKETNKNYKTVSLLCRKSVDKFGISGVAQKVANTYKDVIKNHQKNAKDEKTLLLNTFLFITMLVSTLWRLLIFTTSQTSEK